MSASRAADQAKQAAAAFHTWHSKRTWNAGHPQIDPWMRDVLVALQSALNTITESQAQIAAQVDRNTETLRQIVNHLNRPRD